MNKEKILKAYRNRGRDYGWMIYQPVNLPGYEETLPLAGRNCLDRSAEIVAAIQRRFGGRKIRVIDWGCNCGLFAFELAKLGHEVVGVDRDSRFVEICRFLAGQFDFETVPQFKVGELSEQSIDSYGDFDVAICMSVFHHIRDRKRLLKAFSRKYEVAFVEMDGRGFGYPELFSFYFCLTEIAETNDPYGRGTRRRKTWECSNQDDEGTYSGVKETDILSGRGVFKKTNKSAVTLVKKEVESFSHTWVETDLRHEISMYRRYGGLDIFPSLVDFHIGDERFLEIEFVESIGPIEESDIRELVRVLRDNSLFIIDFRIDSLIRSADGLKVVDLETMFELQSEKEVGLHLRRGKKPPFSWYDDQVRYLAKRASSL